MYKKIHDRLLQILIHLMKNRMSMMTLHESERTRLTVKAGDHKTLLWSASGNSIVRERHCNEYNDLRLETVSNDLRVLFIHLRRMTMRIHTALFTALAEPQVLLFGAEKIQ